MIRPRSFELHRLMSRIGRLFGTIGDTAMFAGVVLIFGLGSSWYMVEAGSRLTTTRIGPWITWKAASRPDADPYTRAHISRSGTLPISAEISPTYVALTDDEGVKLHSACDYMVEGRPPAAHWWSITVFDAAGRLIASPAGRHAYTSDTIALGADGSFTVSLSRDARPGNWLPTARSGRLALVLTKLDPPGRARAGPAGADANAMPSIRKVACR